MTAVDSSSEDRPENGKVANTRQDPVETELKLLVPADSFEEFRRMAIARLPVRNKGTVRHLESTYYDTADRRLAEAGFSLRVRRSGKRFVQTLKSSSGDGALSRREWETPVDTIAADLTLIPAADIGTVLEGIAPEDLLPIFVTRVRRHALLVDAKDAQIEVAFDTGAIEAGSRREPLSEVELELKQGSTAALYSLGLELTDIGPLRLGTQSKSARGYALTSDVAATAAKAGASDILPGDTVDQAIARILNDCHQQLLGNLDMAASGTMPSAIHQMRVALRRLRSLLWLLQREISAPSLSALDREARQLAQMLGAARNWDVFAGSTVPDMADAALPDIDLSSLIEASLPFRDKARNAASEMLGSLQTTRFLLSLGLCIEQKRWRSEIASESLAVLAEPVGHFSERALCRLERKAIKRGRQFGRLQPEERHRLRLVLKKLRYTAEFFLPLYAERSATAKHLKHLKRLQEALGIDNDIATTRELLHQLMVNTGNADVHRAIGAVIGWHRCKQLDGAKGLNSLWKEFKRQKAFWRS